MRLVLESYLHGDSLFFTLTYDENCPGTLEKRDVQLFLKRLRKRLHPRKIRYFITGEYGPLGGRPHYHGILFGASMFDHEAVSHAWGKGFVHVGEFNEATASYVCGYVIKDDSRDPKKRTFAWMSRNPGIGRNALELSGKNLASLNDRGLLGTQPDAPPSIKISGRNRPLGRYLLGKLRYDAGITDGAEPESKRDSRLRELQAEINQRGSRVWRDADEALRRQSGLSAKARNRIQLSKGKLK